MNIYFDKNNDQNRDIEFDILYLAHSNGIPIGLIPHEEEEGKHPSQVDLLKDNEIIGSYDILSIKGRVSAKVGIEDLANSEDK